MISAAEANFWPASLLRRGAISVVDLIKHSLGSAEDIQSRSLNTS